MQELIEQPVVTEQPSVTEEVNVIYVNFCNSVGKPVLAFNADGTIATNASGERQYVPGVFRHNFSYKGEICSVKLGQQQIVGTKQLKLGIDSYNNNRFFVPLGAATPKDLPDLKELSAMLEW